MNQGFLVPGVAQTQRWSLPQRTYKLYRTRNSRWVEQTMDKGNEMLSLHGPNKGEKYQEPFLAIVTGVRQWPVWVTSMGRLRLGRWGMDTQSSSGVVTGD